MLIEPKEPKGDEVTYVRRRGKVAHPSTQKQRATEVKGGNIKASYSSNNMYICVYVCDTDRVGV